MKLDFSPIDLKFLLDLSSSLKTAKYAGTEQPMFTSRNTALMFEATSTRTQAAFEVAVPRVGSIRVPGVPISP